MPGYGSSGNLTSPGWSPARMASAFHELMLRLGYPRHVSQGGDLRVVRMLSTAKRFCQLGECDVIQT
jgi:hypothetical protein